LLLSLFVEVYVPFFASFWRYVFYFVIRVCQSGDDRPNVSKKSVIVSKE